MPCCSARAMLAQHRTAASNAIRCHLLEFGMVIALGFAALSAWRADLNDGKLEMPEALPEIALASLEMLFEQLDDLNARVEACEDARGDQNPRRLPTLSERAWRWSYHRLRAAGFRRGYQAVQDGLDFAASNDLMPKQHSAGAPAKIRRHHQNGATRPASSARARSHDPIATHACTVQGISARHATNSLEQTPKVAAVAMANKNARILWSLGRHNTTYY